MAFTGDPDTPCANCGQRFGEHFGMRCPYSAEAIFVPVEKCEVCGVFTNLSCTVHERSATALDTTIKKVTRSIFLMRLSDVLRRSAVEDAEVLIVELERRLGGICLECGEPYPGRKSDWPQCNSCRYDQRARENPGVRFCSNCEAPISECECN